MLAAHSICKDLGGHPVLQDVSIAISRGECVVALGPNGAGKSVLLQCLSQVLLPDRGSLEVDGQKSSFPLNGRAHVAPWPVVSVVFQNLLHWPHLTFRQSLELVRKGTEPSELTERLLDRLEVRPLLDRLPHQCSGGQKQRFALIRALAVNPMPHYLLADEPSAAVDTAGAVAIAETLNELKALGVGLFVVSHHLGFASRIASRVCFLSEGRIVEQGDRSLLTHANHPDAAEFLGLMQAH